VALRLGGNAPLTLFASSCAAAGSGAMVSAKKREVVIDPRQADRQHVLLGATIRLPGGEIADATITNLSPAGFCAVPSIKLSEGAEFRIELPVGRAPAARIVWIKGDVAGCTFLRPLSLDEVRLIAEIWDGNADRPLA
jgi:hypothetical protein